MLSKLRIKNFKCLRDTGDLEIRPLTFLVGPNSSGKSSVLQMLLILRQTVDSTDIHNPLATSDGWVQMGAYPEFVYRGEYKRDLEVEFEVPGPPAGKSKRGKSRDKFETLSTKAVFGYNPKTTRIEIKEREINLGNRLRERVFREKKGKKFSVTLDYKEKGKRRKWSRHDVIPIKFYDFGVTLKPREKPGDFLKSLPAPEAFKTLAYWIERRFRDLFYLGPLRELPKRFYVTSGQTPQDVGTRGEHAVDVFNFSRWSDNTRIRRIREEVRVWLKEFGIATDIQLDRISKKQNYYRIVITDPATGVETSLADIGFGASQTLPIIIESFYVPPGSTILIEQPEIHLHPKAQCVLGDLFIAAAGDADRTFIIETHSEHVLARIRRRIAEGKIKRDKVAIYYFEPTVDGTHIQEITLTKQGQYDSFPEGFFEEDVAEAFAHLGAMRAPRKR